MSLNVFFVDVIHATGLVYFSSSSYVDAFTSIDTCIVDAVSSFSSYYNTVLTSCYLVLAQGTRFLIFIHFQGLKHRISFVLNGILYIGTVKLIRCEVF